MASLPTPFPYPDVEGVGRAQVGQDLAFGPKLRAQEDGRVVPEVRAEQRITPRVGAKNPPAPAEKSQTPTPHDHERLELFPALLGRRERNLLEDMGRPRLRRHERQLQMVNNPIDRLIIRYNGRIMSLPTRSASSFVLALTRLWTRPGPTLYPDSLGDEERLRIEPEAELARSRLIMGFDQVQPDDLALVAQGDEDVDDAHEVAEYERDALLVEKRVFPLQGRAEPDLEPEAGGELLELPDILRGA